MRLLGLICSLCNFAFLHTLEEMMGPFIIFYPD